MKKYLKIISTLIIICIFTCGCFDSNMKKLPIDSNNRKNKTDEIKENIVTKEVDFFNGEFNDKTIVLEVKNNNKKPVYLNYSFEVYDKNKIKLFNKEVYVRVGSNDSAYVVGIQDLEESSFESYTYNITVINEELENYDSIKKSIRADYYDNGKNIVVDFNNKGKRTTTVYAWLFFYKNNKMVAVKEVKSFNLVSGKTDSIKVNYPIKTINKKISFDKIELIVNEISTEL